MKTLALLTAAPLLAMSLATAAVDKPAPPRKAPAAVEAVAPFDAQTALSACRAEAHRNAKLYALRAHGVRLWRAAEGAQGRSSQSLDRQFDALRAGLHDAAALTDLARAEDAMMALSELTVQQPVIDQIGAAEQAAEMAANACDTLLARVSKAPVDERAASLAALGQLQTLSQRIGRSYLCAPLTKASSAATQAAIARDMAAFEQALAALRNRTANEPALAEPLALVQQQWMFYRVEIDAKRPRVTQSLETVGRASEHLWELLAGAIERHQRLARG
jgi:hypothetical protein